MKNSLSSGQLINAFFLLLITFAVTSVQAMDLVVPLAKNVNDQYKSQLLELVIKHADAKNINVIPTRAGNRRQQIAKVKANELDLLWAPKSQDLEQELLAVEFPIYHGAMGVNALIVRSTDIERFNSLVDLNQLKTYKAGSQRASVTRRVLEQNAFKTISVVNGHFGHMLDGSRFDYFPITVTRAENVLNQWRAEDNLDVVIHPNVLVKLPLQVYFYVNKDNTKLATLIKTSLERAKNSGEFDALVQSSYEFQKAQSFLDKENSKIFEVAKAI
ncbi:hypothetical protein C2869_03780 [Saccharobesus litoralis]|uniref:Uncharacterized protein n=1 Tax=Saccharobesus litoralis TaxID=2172099 RepID=A0A2S0VN61_9ALTE|nr:transporter substrate-binding domain-containing protein [Saccharobesus litoralis]AWB65609.1 hypothetical protein C2869_03780 [Saccharobesus litoralis]